MMMTQLVFGGQRSKIKVTHQAVEVAKTSTSTLGRRVLTSSSQNASVGL